MKIQLKMFRTALLSGKMYPPYTNFFVNSTPIPQLECPAIN